MSSKRLSKRRDSRVLYLSTRENNGLRFHSDNDLTTLDGGGGGRARPAPTAAAAAATEGAEFGSSSSVQVTVGGSDAHSVDGRDRAESLELGRQARIPLVRSAQAARDLHPNGIFAQHSSSGSSESVGGNSLLLSGSRGVHEAAYLTVHGASQRMLQQRATAMMQDPVEHEKKLQRYRELRELLTDIREQKQAKEIELQRLVARERELTSKQQSDSAKSDAAKKCLPTQFLVAVDPEAKGAESDSDSALSVELDAVKQEIAVQKAMVDAHVRLLREAKASRHPKHVRKQRAVDYQKALEKLSQLNLKARNIRDRMSNAEWYDDDSISQSSSFAYTNGVVGGGRSGGCDASSLAGSSSAYHSGPRNASADYYSESLLSGQMYDARSLLSDLSRESSIRSAVSANVPSSISASTPGQAASQLPPHVVPRRNGLSQSARSGSQWRRSNSMGNLLQLADSQPPPAAPGAPINTSFPAQLPPSQPAPYRRTSGADRGPSLSYRYQPGPALDHAAAAASAAEPTPQLSASQQSPYWYTPSPRLEPAAVPPAQQQQRRQQQLQNWHRKQYSDL